MLEHQAAGEDRAAHHGQAQRSPHALTLCLALIIFSGAYFLLGSAARAETIRGKAVCGRFCDNILVYVENVAGKWSGETEVALLDQVNKEYLPHVMAVLVGTIVQLQNSDPEIHNVHIYFKKETVLNISLPFEGQTADANVFGEPGTYVVLCDVHTEMSAYIVVLENPYFTKPDEEGLYAIADLPAGDYTVVLYDPEEKEFVKKKVAVRGESVTVDF